MNRASACRVRICAVSVLVVGLALAVAPRNVLAQQNPREQARQLVVDGLAAQKAGNYDEAIALYEKAYALVPHPELQFNLGQAHRLKGDLERALSYYQRYLDIEPNGRASKDARQWVAEIEKTLAARKAEAELRAAEDAKQAEIARVAAEQQERDRQERERQEREKAERERQEREQQERDRAALASQRAPVAPPLASETVDAPPGRARRKVAIGVGAVGLVSFGAAAYFEMSARSSYDDYLYEPEGDSREALFDRATSQRRIAMGVGAVGAISVGAAAYLWFTGRPPTGDGVAVQPIVGTSMSGIVVRGGF